MAHQNKEGAKTSRVAAISGASGYVGMAIAKQLAADGLLIAALYNTAQPEKMDLFLNQLPGSGHRAYRCDLQSTKETEQVIATIEGDLGAISACIAAAGTGPDRTQLHLSTTESLSRQFETNVFGNFNFIAACAKSQKNRKAGTIIGITTAALISPEASHGLGGYVPAKAALQSMLAVLKDELAPYDIRVHAVAPGFMPGGMNGDIPRAFIEIARAKSPTGTLAEAADVAAAVSKLCSGNPDRPNSFITYAAPEAGLA